MSQAGLHLVCWGWLLIPLPLPQQLVLVVCFCIGQRFGVFASQMLPNRSQHYEILIVLFFLCEFFFRKRVSEQASERERTKSHDLYMHAHIHVHTCTWMCTCRVNFLKYLKIVYPWGHGSNNNQSMLILVVADSILSYSFVLLIYYHKITWNDSFESTL